MAETLRFTVATDQPRYGADEPIRLRLRLTNVGQEPVVVNARFGLNHPQRVGELWLDLTGPTEPPRFRRTSISSA